MNPPKPERRQRRHDVLPAGFSGADGRFYWRPSPTLRKAGWTSLALKGPGGDWMREGDAIERTREIADAVAAWRLGVPVPKAFAHFAPGAVDAARAAADGEAAPAATPFKRLKPHSIGGLLDAYYASPDFTKGLAHRTQLDYRRKLARFVQVLGAPEPGAKPSKVKVAATMALPIDVLAAPERGSAREFQLEVVYEAFRRDAGEHMAHGVMACVSAWLTYCVRRHNIWTANPATLVKRTVPEGRIVVWTDEEIAALVERADQLGHRSVADAIVLAIDLAWSQQDLLHLQWAQISADGCVKHRRMKTNNAGNPPLGAIGKARIAEILARHDGKPPKPYVVLCEATGEQWKADHFRHVFAEVRDALAETRPEVAAKTFRDLRDTAITMCIDGGLTLEETCSRSMHQPTRAQAVIQKHYGMIRQSVADSAAAKLDAYRARLAAAPEPPPAEPPARGPRRLKLVKG